MRCRSDDFVAHRGWWQCVQCGHDDFYQVDRALREATDEGTWMYIPRASEAPPMTSSSRRRRRRRMRGGGAPSEPSATDDGEQAESEAMTHDPVIDPSGPRGLPPGSPHLRHSPQVHRSGSDHRPLPAAFAAGSQPARGLRQLTSSDVQDDRLLAALKKLVAKKDDDSLGDWNSRKGPEKGVRWKTGSMPPVPVWRYDANDMRSYAKFEKKVKIWQLQMAPYAPPKEQALLLYNGLSGEPEQELEHVNIEDIYVDGGVDVILGLLKAPLSQRLVYQKRKFLSDFESFRRYPAESMRSYVSRFRRCMRNLRSLGIDISATYDQEALGSRLLDRSGLHHEAQRGVLIGTQQKLDFELVAESLVLQYPEFRAPPPIQTRDGKGGPKGKSPSSTSSASSASSMASASTRSTASSSSRPSMGSGKGFRRQVYVAEHEAGDDDEEALDPIAEEDAEYDDGTYHDAEEELPPDEDHPDGGDPGDDSDDLGLQELAQVLTVTARKLSGVTLGRKFTTKLAGTKKKSPEEMKKNTHCMACGAVGHWAGDSACPLTSGGAGSNSGAKGAGKPAKSSGYRQPPSKPADKRSMPNDRKPHAVNVIHHEHGSVRVSQDDGDGRYGNIFQVNMVNHPVFEVNQVTSNPGDFHHYMVLDSACQRSCCGQQWFIEFKDYLFNHDLIPKVIPCDDVFQFGKGSPTQAQQRAYLPCFIGGQPLLLGTALLPERIPFLGSNQLMNLMGTIIDMPNQQVTFQALGPGITVKLHSIAGHLAVNIFDVMGMSARTPVEHDAWQGFSNPEMWHDPHPELMLPEVSMQAQTRLKPKQFDDSHETFSTAMARSVAAVRTDAAPFRQEPGGGVDSSRKVEGAAQRMDGNQHAAGDGDWQRRSSTMPTSSEPDPALWQQEGPVRQVSPMFDGMEVESRAAGVGRLHRNTLLGKLFGTVVTIATALLGQHQEFQGVSQGFTEGQAQSEGAGWTSNAFTARAAQHDSMREDLQPPLRPLDRVRAGDGSSAPHPGVTSGPTGRVQHVGSPGIPQRSGARASSTPDDDGARAPPAAGHDQQGRDPVRRGSEHRGRGVRLARGTVKRLRGEWKQSAQVLAVEREAYEGAGCSSMQRPPPNIDVYELFAGSAGFSRLARDYNLNALQPIDLLYGQDLKDPGYQKQVLSAIDKYRPWLVPMGIDCRWWNIFNHNLNWSHRQDELAWHQEEERPLVRFSTKVALRQYRAGRLFLLENPVPSRIWDEPEVQHLRGLPGVWTVDLHAGAFGKEIDGDPVIKPMRFMGNQPGLDEALNRKLDALEKSYCKPIQGSMTKRSQEYPELLCRIILYELKAFIYQNDPFRFAQPLHQVLPVAHPVADLSQWDGIVDHLEKSFENSSKRPFDVPLSSTLGKDISDLMRMDAFKIQVTYAPTTRRLPFTADNADNFEARAALLVYSDGSRAIEIENLAEIQFPRQRFHKAVKIGVFVYGKRRQEEQVQQPTDSHGHLAMPNLSTDITFPSSPNIPAATKQAIARLHINFGHPSASELMRLMAHQNVPAAIIKTVQDLKCATCWIFLLTFAWRKYQLTMMDGEPGDKNTIERDAYRFVIEQVKVLQGTFWIELAGVCMANYFFTTLLGAVL
eukprot:Skav209599  [mRNA]  locus=scaffold4140:22593:36171:- [translate_table: standard]